VSYESPDEQPGVRKFRENCMKRQAAAFRPGKQVSQAERATTREGLEEQIRLRAYQIYEQRGIVDGSASDDWVQAEAEFRETK
jgi:hypothetical protein